MVANINDKCPYWPSAVFQTPPKVTSVTFQLTTTFLSFHGAVL